MSLTKVQSGMIGGVDATTLTGVVPVANGGTGLSSLGPTFSAWQSVGQSYASGYNKVQLQTKEWDTANCFDNVTNYRFTPNVAGYYQFSFNAIAPSGSRTTEQQIFLYKNGASYKSGIDINANAVVMIGGSAMAVANGTTDYFELYYYLGTAGTSPSSQQYTYFQGFLARPL